MANLKPIGSEKLEGDEKIARIMEIANYGKTSSKINESNKLNITEFYLMVMYIQLLKKNKGILLKEVSMNLNWTTLNR